MPGRSRPLSPFLHYRWQYTNTLSILHRVVGIILSVGYLALVYWVTALASGSAAYERALLALKVPLALGLLAFAFHFCNGIRHLFWDLGFGLERPAARRSAWLVGTGTLLIAVIACLAWVSSGDGR